MVHKKALMAAVLAILALAGLSCQTRVTPPSITPTPITTPGVSQVVVPEGKTPVQSASGPVPPAQHAIKVLPVPFTPQAPYANWDATHEEACEEASMLMVAEYFGGNHNSSLAAAYADPKILALIDWETQNGYTVDVTAAQVVVILKQHYKLSAEAVPYTAVGIRSAIDQGKLVILPAAGRLLGNPNFTQPGPLYHMLIVKGYEGNEFITNDPGTKKGESYRYDESAFARAVHDWNGGDVEHGAQVMVVVGRS